MLPLLLGAALANPLDDGPVESLTLRFDSRYDRIDGGAQANRLQNSALVSFTLDLAAGVQLAAMAVTGDDFTSRWHTWYDLRDGDTERMALALRQLYVQRWFGPLRVQAGSLAPVKGSVSTTGLEDLGWIDGVRAEVHSSGGGVVEVVGGSLTDPGEPDLFLRQRRLDYGELEAGHPLPLGLAMEGAVHVLGEAIYPKAELSWRGDGRLSALQLRVEGAVQARSGATQGAAGVWADVGQLATDREGWHGRLRTQASCRWVDPDFGIFGALAEDFYQYGGECRLRARGHVDPKGYLAWDVRYIAPITADLVPRLDVGLTLKLALERPP